ncbi:DMT family transporter [Aestuariivita sp.]|jgi:drug/metabolite transporter (DMT)-like permease|uniref:DMT family transporter n=1 Tax=Aestuariivita sp. TaxID=1872407 RepID=UPI0021729B42|nr:DMT family transporter [Aestuariivita sp.]MCE8006301.1 DMT family transporter [Aestuariivita sp.]
MAYLPAILWVLLSTALWTLIFAAGKFADGALDPFQITVLRYFGALLTLLVLVPSQGGIGAHRSNQPLVHFARAVSGCGAAVAITWASANMPLIQATAIGMLYGVLALLLGMVVLKERVSPRHWIAVVVSVAGVSIILFGKGAFQGGWSVLPALATLASATLFAVEGVLISVLGRAERAFTVMLYVTVFGLGLMAWPAYAGSQPTSWEAALLCVALGPLGVLAQYCTIRGYRSAPLSVVAPVDYSWLLFSAVLGAVIFTETPGIATWIGCGAIILGGVVLVGVGRRG